MFLQGLSSFSFVLYIDIRVDKSLLEKKNNTLFSHHKIGIVFISPILFVAHHIRSYLRCQGFLMKQSQGIYPVKASKCIAKPAFRRAETGC